MVTNTPSQQKYRKIFWFFLAALTLLRLFFANKAGLGVDEGLYLLYARNLAWGYFDHPPMVAFLAAVTTLGGEGLFFIRLGPIICSGISLILLRRLALALYGDERIALGAVVLLALMPYQHLLMVALLPDATLNLFWCGTLLAFWHATQKESWAAWILAGLLFGGALLSKYHGVLLPACLFFYWVTTPDQRFWLRRIQPYAAVLIGLLVFLPNIFWNAQHNWISYAYQLFHGVDSEFGFDKVLEVIAGQLGAWSPLIFGLLITAAVVIIKQKKLSTADRFVLWNSLPIFGFFCINGFFGDLLPHWTSVGWWTGSLIVAKVVMDKIREGGKVGNRWRRWTVAAAIIGILMSAVVYIGILYPIVQPLYSAARDVSLKLNRQFPDIKPLEPYQSRFDPSNELYGWQEIATQVEQIRAEMPNPEKTFVFCHRFYTTNLIAPHLKTETVATSLHRKFSQYRLWYPAEDFIGWDALFIVDYRPEKRARRYMPLFDKMDQSPTEIRIFRREQPAHEMKVYKYYGFKGKFEQD